MKYVGSKARHAKEIIPIILRTRCAGQWYVEPFVGGANVIDKIDGNRLGADKHPALIALLKAMAEGWEPPQKVTEADYRRHRQAYAFYGPGRADALTGYIGFNLSYGGKWFGGYRRDKEGRRDYSLEAYNHHMKQMPGLRGVSFRCCDYRGL